MAIDPIDVRDRLRAAITAEGDALVAAARRLHQEPLEIHAETLEAIATRAVEDVERLGVVPENPAWQLPLRELACELMEAVVASDPFEALVFMDAYPRRGTTDLDEVNPEMRVRGPAVHRRLDAGRISHRERDALDLAHRAGAIGDRVVRELAAVAAEDPRTHSLTERLGSDLDFVIEDLLSRLTWVGGTVALGRAEPPADHLIGPEGPPPREVVVPERPPTAPYGPGDLHANVQFAHRYLEAASDGPEALVPVRHELLADYHPARVAQIDMVLCNPGVAHTTWALNVRKLLWLAALPADLRARAERLGLDAATLDEMIAISARFAETGFESTPVEYRAFADERTRLLGSACEAELLPRLEQQLRSMWDRLTDLGPPSGERLAGAVACALGNVLLMSMDSPDTSIGASVVAYHAAAESRFPTLLARAEPPREAAGIARLAEDLAGIAQAAERQDLAELAYTARVAEGMLVQIDDPVEALAALDGQWSVRVIACRECAMPNVALTAAGLDPSLPGLHDGERVIVPRGLNRHTCCFCAREQTVNAPAVFFVPDRGPIIYCLPTPDPEAAIDLHGAEIERIRGRYAATLDEAERERYFAAPEILTYNWEQFMSVARTGETVPEDHEYRIIGPMANGDFAISDPAKRFLRFVTAEEAIELGFTSQ